MTFSPLTHTKVRIEFSLDMLKVNAMLVALVKKGLISKKDQEAVDKFGGLTNNIYEFFADFF